jgi:hypothetical protein
MTQASIEQELLELRRTWSSYLVDTPYEIKHRKDNNGKTNIINTYSSMIQRTQELYAIQRELLCNNNHW